MSGWTKLVEVLVTYDIRCAKIRNRVINGCKDYGLERIQMSVFRGSLTVVKRRELLARLRREVRGAVGNIQVYPLCAADSARSVEIGGRLV